MEYDFSGWATKNNLRCADGRTILKNAFKDNDGQKVPLVWNHQHNDPTNILGHALLENRNEGVYAYCSFNDTEAGRDAKTLVQHGDINALSIYANHLTQQGGNVIHGAIREVSLVLAGANPGAMIDAVLAHSESGEEGAIIYTGEEILMHSNDEGSEDMAEEKTVQDVFDEMTDEQKQVVYALIGSAVEDALADAENDEEYDDEEYDDEEYDDEDYDDEEESDMKHNVFDNEYEGDVLTHADMEVIMADAQRFGSLKESVLQHGLVDIDVLFPDATAYPSEPNMVTRDMGWVSRVIGGVHHTPFSRVKSLSANLTAEDARAKGYVKGNFKIEEVVALLKRETTPTTIYKKQKLDRDDVVDITDFDVVAWLKREMRMMLDEEIARAILVGDGRSAASNDKINELNIRPVWTDSDFYSVKAVSSVASNATDDDKAKSFIRTAVKARKNYKGSGDPVLFTTEDVLTNCLLMEDQMGRVIYETVDKLKSALRVKDIITVPVMEGLTRSVEGTSRSLLGIILNLKDYNVGADKGGSVNMFDDFDIDYNAQKYLIETRCSGALIKPYSAIVVEEVIA